MGIRVEQECPQCGGTIELDETDRLLRCPFCDVKSFLFSPGYFRFVLPHKAREEDLIYVPYLRFRGSVYYCRGLKVGYRIVDITHRGLALRGLPGSLGVRPQAMKVRFVSHETPGVFLKFSLKASDILMRAGNLSSAVSSGRLFHRAFIGETLSLIYLPLYIKKGRLFDGVVNKPFAELGDDEEAALADLKRASAWKIDFLPTLCPHCGWNLSGERDSMVMTCTNCETAWAPSKRGFARVPCFYVPATGDVPVYLPFWKITARCEGLDIKSVADFMRETNQPRVPPEEWERADMTYWAPAFKIRPKVFLTLSRALTVSQKLGEVRESLPGKSFFPVTLPGSEAIQSLKMILAGSAVNKRDVLPLLPHVKFVVKASELVYLPFNESANDLVLEHVGTSINKNTLEYGRSL